MKNLYKKIPPKRINKLRPVMFESEWKSQVKSKDVSIGSIRCIVADVNNQVFWTVWYWGFLIQSLQRYEESTQTNLGH